jgi:hypothetical protein
VGKLVVVRLADEHVTRRHAAEQAGPRQIGVVRFDAVMTAPGDRVDRTGETHAGSERADGARQDEVGKPGSDHDVVHRT